jgi:hypothetical protein
VDEFLSVPNCFRPTVSLVACGGHLTVRAPLRSMLIITACNNRHTSFLSLRVRDTPRRCPQFVRHGFQKEVRSVHVRAVLLPTNTALLLTLLTHNPTTLSQRILRGPEGIIVSRATLRVVCRQAEFKTVRHLRSTFHFWPTRFGPSRSWATGACEPHGMLRGGLTSESQRT